MNKYISTLDHSDALLRSCGGRTFIFVDDSINIKSASSDAFTRKMILENHPDKDHFAVHYVSMGGGEWYGANRNGDFWPEEMLLRRHGTFVTHGNYFREHANRDPKKRIGIIKAAAYNKAMHRGELIVWGNKKKAEAEYERAKKGEDLDGSMSARVPGDWCSCCGHFAKSSEFYCPDLRYRMLQYNAKYGKFNYAINKQGTFFDFSAVLDRADRVARHLEVVFHDPEELEKAASFGGFKFSDQRATDSGIFLPESESLQDPAGRAWLTKLAAAETYVSHVLDPATPDSNDIRFQFVKLAHRHAFSGARLSATEWQALQKIDPSVLFRGLAKQAAVLDFPTFYAYSTKQSVTDTLNDPGFQHARQELLPTMFKTATVTPMDPQLEALFEPASAYKVASISYMTGELTAVVQKLAQANSVQPDRVRARMMYSSVAPTIKVASKAIPALNELQREQAKKLVNAYAVYKVAFCKAVTDLSGQDFIDEPMLLLLTSHSRN